MEDDKKKPRKTQNENLESLKLEVRDLQTKMDQLYSKLNFHIETPNGHISKSIIYWSFGSVVALVTVLWLLPLR